jgi:hypothetical protein
MQGKSSAVLVFVIGLLMSGSFSIDFEDVHLIFSLEWFLPLVAAWLAQRYGIQALYAWWPLAFMPFFGFSLWNGHRAFDGLGISFSMSTATLLLGLTVAAALDPRLTKPPLEKWLRPHVNWLAIAAFSLLVGESLLPLADMRLNFIGEHDDETRQYRDVTLYPLAAVATSILLVAIRWEALARAIASDTRRRWVRTALILGAAIVLSGMAVHMRVGVKSSWGMEVGSWMKPSTLLVPITSFCLVAYFGIRLRSIFSILLAGLVIDALLLLVASGDIGPISLTDSWERLHWDVLVQSIAAALSGRIFSHFLRHGSFKSPEHGQIIITLLSLIFVVSPLLEQSSPSSGVAILWIIASIAFVVGVQWHEHSLIFVPPLLQFMWLLAAAIVPDGNYSSADYALPDIGMISFAFAFCGAFFSISRQLGPSEQEIRSGSLTTLSEMVKVADVSALAKVVDKIDRSTTWRSFLVAAVPFIVLWQLFELYGVQILAQEANDTFGEEPLQETWHIAAAAVLLTLAPFAFVLWDWIDRRDSLRMLALLTGGLVGVIWSQVFGSVLGMAMKNNFERMTEDRLLLVGILAFPVILIGSGLLARTKKRMAPRVFLGASGLIGLALVAALGWLPWDKGLDILERAGGLVVGLLAFPVVLLGSDLLTRSERTVAYRIFLAGSGLIVALVAILGWLSMDEDVETRQESVVMVAFVIISAFIAVVIARFAELRLLLAMDRPRELLFGALHDKRFWARMAAAAGLPSTLWQGNALHKPAFWALISSRLVVYLGGVLFRYWAMTGAAVVMLGHMLFYGGKRLGAREIWRPQSLSTPNPPILFLRSFDDDQCDFRRPRWALLSHWLDLWSFRRNLDEAMIDEIAQFGPVIALGRPSDKRTPFGAMRHYSANADWQRTLTDAACSAQAIILVASDSPGVQWEYNLLKSEGMLEKVLLLFPPDSEQRSVIWHAAEWFHSDAGAAIAEATAASLVPIGIMLDEGNATLFAASTSDAAAYVLFLRLYFHERSIRKAATSYETQEEARQKKKLLGLVGGVVGIAVILGLVLSLELPHSAEQSPPRPTSTELGTVNIETHDMDIDISSSKKKPNRVTPRRKPPLDGCTRMAKVFPRTPARPLSGSARPPNRDMLMRKPILV